MKEPNWDLIQEQCEQFEEREFLENPDLKVVAENAGAEDIAELLNLLLMGYDTDALAKAEQILQAVAADQAHFKACKTVKSERNNWESSSAFPEMRKL